ncbi:MAG: polysaccharide biosynthesis/export family protein [Rikenellaceae bacterium]
MKTNTFLAILLCIIALASCSTVKDISYFQNAQPNVGVEMTPPQDIRFMAGDRLSILVNTKDPLLDNLFNLSVANRIIGSENPTTNQNYVATYSVNPMGTIDFPILGLIRVEGMTRYEVSQDIKSRLKREELANDPIVTVEFSGLSYSVLGEVTRPGHYNIESDNLTIIDALSMAGDLTIYGKRENVTLFREVDGKQVPYVVNLLDMENIYNSPALYVRQNDMIYVEPNEVRSRQSTVNGNNIRSTSFWISLTSLFITISLLFI